MDRRRFLDAADASSAVAAHAFAPPGVGTLATQPALQAKTQRELLTSLPSLPDTVRNAVRNNGGGHANHALYWQLLSPGGAKAPRGELLKLVNRDFMKYRNRRADYLDAALGALNWDVAAKGMAA